MEKKRTGALVASAMVNTIVGQYITCNTFSCIGVI